ncbi:MAG: tRNA uridine-5-carboxymethylaminomethyl(34) synthesis GTPase MnmE [Ferrovum sp.]|nr:tRNA uridine-5-carboxymethylaminomethyl(34) synthesis GTPase MnmE [Ferrovum sp.]
MELSPDTIVALATAPSPAGVGVLRLSGSNLADFSLALTGKPLPRPRFASLRPFYDSQGLMIDAGLLLYFSSPHSYTGEDVLEIHAHGSIAVLHALQEHCIVCGARLANPGEFTLRAYLNHKIDLNQAEAVADLIAAESLSAAHSAANTLAGVFSKEVHGIIDDLINIRVYLESHFDFSDEEDIAEHGQDEQRIFKDNIRQVISRVDQLLENSAHGMLLRQGKTIVLIGSPNVGKSSLLNALTEEDHALVTPIPGTTRDLIRGHLVIQGIPLHLIDTAGIRETIDPVEIAGIDKTWQAIQSADIALIVLDIRFGLTVEDENLVNKLPHNLRQVFVLNKRDLLVPDDLSSTCEGIMFTTSHAVSAKTGEGLAELKGALLDWVGGDLAAQEAPLILARERHIFGLKEARAHLMQALEVSSVNEFAAEDLRLAQNSLSSVGGTDFVADDLLGEIFSRFCIGK